MSVTDKIWEGSSRISRLLKPLSYLYLLGYNIAKKANTPAKQSVPVICVGNITVGGTGKTPVVSLIAQILKAHDRNPNIISRGYGGRIKKSTLVNINTHTADDVGDEPVMLAHDNMVWVGSNKSESARMAINAGADILVMDDGLQSQKLKSDFNIIVIDSSFAFGNRMILPAGPLREPLHEGLNKAHLFIVMGSDNPKLENELSPYAPVIRGKILPIIPDIINGSSVYAFAGIGRPVKFFKSLINGRIRLSKTKGFPDHYNYTNADIEAIINEATKLEIPYIVTTEKDYVKIPTEYHNKILCIKTEVVIPTLEDIIISRFVV